LLLFPSFGRCIADFRVARLGRRFRGFGDLESSPSQQIQKGFGGLILTRRRRRPGKRRADEVIE
jgi:hypothetical protein